MPQKLCYYLSLFCLAVFVSCSGNQEPPVKNPFFTLLSPETTGVTFENTITETLKFNLFSYRNMYNGGGVGIGDINNDDRPDLYFISNQGKNKLYLNEGDFKFTNITQTAGVSGSAFWSTGVSMVDINNDGYLDIYVLNSGDIFGDNRRNELFINQGDSTFVEQAAAYGLDFNSFSVHASFFDYDADGDLDCYLLNNSYHEQKPKGWRADTRSIADSLGGDKLLRNDPHPEREGQRLFTDVSQQAGIHQGELGFGLGLAVGDVNQDHRPDIYVSNDFWERDYLYINQGDGTFKDSIINSMDHISQSSMGNDIADLNNDGMLDIYVTDMLANTDARLKTMTMFDAYHRDEPNYHQKFHYQYVHNTLQYNDGTGLFSEMAFTSGVAATDWSWAPLLFDFDNDGWRDIYVTNGVLRDITDLDFSEFVSNRQNIERIVREKGTFNIADFLGRMPSQKVKNTGFVNNRDKTFTKKSDSLGFYTPSFSNGAAYGDLDNDGDLDLVVNNINESAFVYRNNAEKLKNNHFLKIKFQGPLGNPRGIGSKVKLYHGSTVQVAEHYPAKVYQSTLASGLHFGLGTSSLIDSLEVIWPDGSLEIKKGIQANQTITVDKRDAVKKPLKSNEIKNSDLLTDLTSDLLNGDITYEEKFVNDFENEPMLPQMLSTLGPAILKEDFNNDEKADFWVGGANDSADKIFMQQPDGTFKQTSSPEFEFDRIFESTAAAAIDINGDGYLDLLVGSSGYNNPLESGPYALRAYENNGRGIFIKRPNWAPKINISTKVMLAEDVDGDGDKDLFIGGRVVPKNYGQTPRSYLLQNDGNGEWTDITPGKLKQAGMITDAAFTDYNSNDLKDLAVVGKWMPVTFFKNENGTLTFDKQIGGSEGWWTAIEPVDLDGDTDTDFVLGNWGTNSLYRASPERPMTLYTSDFDGDKQPDFVINSYYMDENISTPAVPYRTLASEFPDITRRISSHHEYANKKMEDIFTEAQLSESNVKKVVTLNSSLLINQGGERFTLKKLPLEAQVSPVYSIIARDFNSDGNTDLLLLGNQHDVKPEVGRLGSNHGVLVVFDDSLNARFVPYQKTGNNIRGEIRDAVSVSVGGEDYLLIGRNNANMSMYKMGVVKEIDNQ